MKSTEKRIREKLNLPDAPAEVDANDLWAAIETNLPPASEKPKAIWPSKSILLSLALLLAGGAAWLLYFTPSPAETSLAEVPSARATTAEHRASPDQSATTYPNPTATKTTRAADNEATRPVASAPGTLIPSVTRENASFRKSGTVVSAPNVNLPRPATTDKPQLTDTKNLANTYPTEAPTPKALFEVEDAVAVEDIRTTAEGPASKETSSAPRLSRGFRFAAPAAAPPSEAPLTLPSSTPEEESKPRRETASTNEVGAEAGIVAAAAETPTQPTIDAAEEGAEDQASSFKSARSSRLIVGLHAGTNLLYRQYTSTGEDLGQSLNEAVSSAAGTSFGLDLTYRFTDKLSVTTGLEYHRTLNPFDHTAVTDTMIDHPSEFNGGLIRAIAKRRTTHNHRLSFLTVPLLVNHTWAFGDFDLGIGAGIGLNFLQSSTGKTLDANRQVVAYDNASGAADVPDFFLSYRLRPVLSWRPKPDGKLRFEFSGNLSYQTFGISPLSGVKQSGFLIGGSVGLRYGF